MYADANSIRLKIHGYNSDISFLVQSALYMGQLKCVESTVNVDLSLLKGGLCYILVNTGY